MGYKVYPSVILMYPCEHPKNWLEVEVTPMNDVGPAVIAVSLLGRAWRCEKLSKGGEHSVFSVDSRELRLAREEIRSVAHSPYQHHVGFAMPIVEIPEEETEGPWPHIDVPSSLHRDLFVPLLGVDTPVNQDYDFATSLQDYDFASAWDLSLVFSVPAITHDPVIWEDIQLSDIVTASTQQLRSAEWGYEVVRSSTRDITPVPIRDLNSVEISKRTQVPIETFVRNEPIHV